MSGCWILDAGCLMLDAGCSILDSGCWEDRVEERETWGARERNEWMLVLINDIMSLFFKQMSTF